MFDHFEDFYQTGKLSQVEDAPKYLKHANIWNVILLGYSTTRWTKFYTILTHPPWVDNCEHLTNWLLFVHLTKPGLPSDPLLPLFVHCRYWKPTLHTFCCNFIKKISHDQNKAPAAKPVRIEKTKHSNFAGA